MLWFMLTVLFLMLAGSVWINVKLTKKCLQMSEQRDDLVDVIEESLDVLDSCYTSIAHAAEIPVLSDEPVVKNLLADIRRSKNAVLAIAGKVVVYGQEKDAQQSE